MSNKPNAFEFTTPEWVKDAIFYQIFPDRFARSERLPKPSHLEPWDSPPSAHGFKGGDLYGVIEHLDYLQDLGINAIYFNPIFQSASNHRYHTHDYYRVDPLLGGDPAFRELVDKARRAGISIVLDGVFNHASRGFFQFNHILETGPASPYLDWFDVKGFPLNAYHGKPNYSCWWGLPALPEFNTHNPQVRQFIFGIARYWIEQGIDGWRLDVPACIDDDSFWQEFRGVVKAANPHAYLVGEIAEEAQRWLSGDQFDAVMNYQLTQACLGFFGGETIDRKVAANMMGLPGTPVLDAAAFARRTVELLDLYPRQAAFSQLNLLDSHDMPRFVTLASGDKSAYRLAVLFLMTYPGAPCIYYGDEIGMQGGTSGPPEPARGAFPWNPAVWDSYLRKYIQQCIAIRKKYPALRRGDYSIIHAEGQVFAYSRHLGDDTLVIAINNGVVPVLLDLPVVDHLREGNQWEDLFSHQKAGVSSGRLSGFTMPARSGCVLSHRERFT